MTKIVINKCYGGFSISKAAAEWMAARGSEEAKRTLEEESKLNRFYGHIEVERDDPFLVGAVEALEEEANGSLASLRIVEIPEGTDWVIEEYDGVEWVAERHQTWG